MFELTAIAWALLIATMCRMDWWTGIHVHWFGAGYEALASQNTGLDSREC